VQEVLARQTTAVLASAFARLLVRGFDEKSGYVIDAWYNKVTKTIETAFPPATHL
jgi:hypothetical protein